MLAHQRQHLRAHVVAADAVETQLVQYCACRFSDRFVVFRRRASGLRGGDRFPKIVTERRKHNRYTLRLREIACELDRFVQRKLRMRKSVLRRVIVFLRQITNKRADLGKELIQYAQFKRRFQSD